MYQAARTHFDPKEWLSWHKLSEEEREFFRREARLVIYVSEGATPRLENYQFWRFLAVTTLIVLSVVLFSIATVSL